MTLAQATIGGLVFAQPETDRAPAALFDEAREAFAKKDYAVAARKFEAAYRRAPRGQTAYNAALSWDAAGEHTHAADALALALEDASLPSGPRAHAQARLVTIEKSVLTMRLDAPDPATVSVDDVESRPLPATLHLRPGRHELVVRFENGATVRQEIDSRAGEHVSLKVAPPAVDPAMTEPDRRSLRSPSTPPRVPIAVRAPTPAPNTSGGAQRTVGWVLLGTSAAATAGAIYLGVRGVNANSDYDASGNVNESARSDAVSFRTWANVAWVSTIALGTVGVVLLLTAPRGAAASRTDSTFVAGIGTLAGTF